MSDRPENFDPIQRIVDVCRAAPYKTHVRMRINRGEWQTMLGSDFLALWDTPFAGTIDVDAVVLDREEDE